MIKTNKMISILLLILLVIVSDVIVKGNNNAFAEEKTNFSYRTVSEIVMEKNTNRVLYENNAYEKKYMASTTKILTAITIIENCNLDEVVSVTSKTVGIEGSSIYLEAGEKLSVRHLLYGLMLRSGNDCAETLAVFCSGSIEKFAVLMNETANKIGAENSNFANPHGLHDDNHYTTAYDLALITCYAMKNEDFRTIVGTKSVNVPYTTHDYDRRLVNKNKMLFEFDGATGVKTGFTKKAGRCLVSSCLKNGMELICVVLNCAPMFERSKTLLSDCFNGYSMQKVIESDEIIDFLPLNDDDTFGEKCPVCVLNDVYLPLSESEKSSLIIKFVLPEKITKPIKKDCEIGRIEFLCENNLIFSEKIYTMIDVM